MFKISDFSRLSQVSMRTLRYYDEIGLLKPVQVDYLTGYRYYSVDQLPRLNRILALKDLGFELAQIIQLLDEELPSTEMRGMLRLKQAELQQRVQAEQERLARVEARLTQIELDGRTPRHEIILKKVKPQIVASSRKIVANFVHRVQFASEILDLLSQNKVKQTDSPLFIYHDGGYRDNDMNVEIAVPVDSSSVGNIVERSGGRITVRELPGVNTMATLIYHGSPYTLIEPYQALGTWIQANDYTITGPCRTISLHQDEDLSTHVTEIQFPVEKSSSTSKLSIFFS
ncbi:MerR family transcriptional regulator [Ktedonosporobacter rubrisoli]|uniref:MerR family transcriptional regulator n=1 Tax=Ktedonosporobacter rubrisoli TaxID=2509675 RepID=A0A4P6K2H5_KTERU|nr:MerR family transcriptional regulator [Ktedonosporobacter rubrisoli]QBD82063.1 MerR family transcriptional regulator [Ktedonosporobacter rubrisoli]